MMTPGSPTATGGTPTPTFGRCSWGRTSSSPSRGGNWSSGSGRASSSPSWTARGNGASRSRSWGSERRAPGAGPTGKGTQVTLTAIARKVERGGRLSPADGVIRLPGEEGAWTLTREEILGKVQELTALGGTEVLFQGGLNPALKIGWYEETFAAIKAAFPVHLHALSPAELLYLAKISGLSLAATLERLKRAGLDSIPGGGAEIVVDAVRQEISPLKDTAEEWLACMRTAHHLGIPSSATMMYGSVETPEQRVEHLCRIRAIQDETGGFTAFIAWNYQPDHTALGGT